MKWYAVGAIVTIGLIIALLVISAILGHRG